MKDYAEMLQALADKFGTTVEHLWGVLVKQAAISATVDAAIVIALVSVVVWGFRFVREITKEPEQVEGERTKYPECDDEGIILMWAIWAVLTLLAVVGIFDVAQNIVAGYLNPEYWALMELKK